MPSSITFNQDNGPIDDIVASLINEAGDVKHREWVREMILTALRAGQDSQHSADVRLICNTMKEMWHTTRVFAPYRERRKVTIFGSARTAPDDYAYQACAEMARILSDRGYMIITGGGPGIMQAGNEGAGCENSFAVNIRLPFEQSANHVMVNSPRTINYKYFFTRKVAFVRQADAITVFPGGFGTLDEAMEVFTLIQTGKTTPKPLILIDSPDGYWEHVIEFMHEHLLAGGMISSDDFALFKVTKSPEEAADIIDQFYRNYHSIRFYGETIAIRLQRCLPKQQLTQMLQGLSGICTDLESIECGPAVNEDGDAEVAQLQELRFAFNHQKYGHLMTLIDQLNNF